MDPSIGNYIKVVVVKIILVEEIDAAKGLQVSTNADSTLASFCRWQQGLNPGDDNNPHHHDVAILVTRKDICSQHNSPCRYELHLNMYISWLIFVFYVRIQLISFRDTRLGFIKPATGIGIIT